MDRHVGARKLVADLVNDEQSEVRRAEIIGRDLAQWCESMSGPPSGERLEAWLDEHAQVLELYATAKLLGELAERYLTPPPPEPVYVDARHPELEAQLADGPDVPEPYLVYADWLQVQSDPIGELIALGVAATADPFTASTRFEEHLKQHDTRFFGTLTKHLWDHIALQWKYGLVRGLEEVNVYGWGRTKASQSPTEVWEELLQLRVCSLLQSISFCRPLDRDRDERIHAAAAPTLKELSIVSHGWLPACLLGRPLRSLEVALGASPASVPDLPETLEKLRLRGLSGLALIERCPAALTQLVIADGVLDRRDIAKLVKLPITRQLTSLALVNVELTDDKLQMLVDARGVFPALVELDVSLNELTDDGLARAKWLTPNVIGTRQARPGNAAERRIWTWAGSRLGAAETIAEPAAWQNAGRDGTLRWARYRGDAEYELFVSADLERYGCSCPSRYQPCKHVVALALLAERTPLSEAPAPFET